jgi:hypothetical protein
MIVENSIMKHVNGFEFINPEEHNESVWQKRCLDKLVELGVKEVYSARPKNAMKDQLFGFSIHYSPRQGDDFFHYDFVSPTNYGLKFKERGIELKEFKR